MMTVQARLCLGWVFALAALWAGPALAQLTDRTQAPNTAGGESPSLSSRRSARRRRHHDARLVDVLIERDPARAVPRAPDLPCKFSVAQASARGPATGWATSPPTTRSARARRQLRRLPRPPAGAAAPAATWPRGPTAATRRLFGLGLWRCSATNHGRLRAIRATAWRSRDAATR